MPYVVGIQEIKWFESDIWLTDDWTFLHSGRILPVEGDVVIRREDVHILLDGRATGCWGGMEGCVFAYCDS